jgi:hypothetical protein
MSDGHGSGRSWTTFEAIREHYLARAKSQGIERPVLFIMSHASRPGQAVYSALAGKEIPPAPAGAGGEEFGPAEVADLGDAARLLRRHADAAGALAADFLEDPALAADWWLVLLTARQLGLAGWDGDARVAGVWWPYDQVSRSVQAPTKMAADDGPCMMTLASGGDQFFEVFGRTGLDVAGAGILVALASDFPGFTDIPDPLNGDRPVRARVTRELVRGFLANVYRDQPHQVAEAVRSLQKGEPAKADWLLRVMRNEPGLLELYRAVRFELAGEEGA